MAYRLVTHLVRDENGDIVLLCNHREFWSPKIAEEAVREIEQGLHTYYMFSPENQPDVELRIQRHADKGPILVAGSLAGTPGE